MLDKYQKRIGRVEDIALIQERKKDLEAKLARYNRSSIDLKNQLVGLENTLAICEQSSFCDKPVLLEKSEYREYILHVEILPHHIATIRVYKPKGSFYNHFSIYTTHKFKHEDLKKYNLYNYGTTFKSFDKTILSTRKVLAEFIKTIIDIEKPSKDCKDCKFKSIPIEMCKMYECGQIYNK